MDAAHAADAAGRAVELLLGGVVVEEAALQAGVGAKDHAAAEAGRAHWLPQLAQRADHLPDPRPVQLVPLARVLLPSNKVLFLAAPHCGLIDSV